MASTSITTVGGVVVVTQVIPKDESSIPLEGTPTAGQAPPPVARAPPPDPVKMDEMTAAFMRGHPMPLGVSGSDLHRCDDLPLQFDHLIVVDAVHPPPIRPRLHLHHFRIAGRGGGQTDVRLTGVGVSGVPPGQCGCGHGRRDLRLHPDRDPGPDHHHLPPRGLGSVYKPGVGLDPVRRSDVDPHYDSVWSPGLRPGPAGSAGLHLRHRLCVLRQSR